ncbi:MAG: PIG-L family deacetylase [Gammaproteobacteria bacterium]|nr:PIG-L family deacetylase [Gammaproteobacteria bacterium]
MIDLSKVRALVIAPHPDDEVFGCGGIIHRIKREGGKVYVMYVTVGTAKDFSDKGISTADERISEIEKVADYLDFDDFDIALSGDKYHLKLDAIPQGELVHAIERGSKLALHIIEPNLVLTTSNHDYNQDHRAVFKATVTALRPASLKQKSYQSMLATYELPYHAWNTAETLSSSSLYVKLEEADLSAKIEALKLYQSQLKQADSPLSVHGVKTMASYRGLQCGAMAAETFWLKRLAIL